MSQIIIRVTSTTLNVRSGPSTSYSIVRTIPLNSQWYVLSSTNGWYKIADNQWIYSVYTKISTIIKKVQITTSQLNIRSGPASSYPIVGTLSKDTIVDVIEILPNGWYKIDNYKYIYGLYTKDAVTSPTKYQGKVLSTSLNVRSGPSTSYKVVRKLPQNSVVNIYEEKSGWYRVGYQQWISKDYVSIVSITPSSYDNNQQSWYYVYKGQGIIPEANNEILKLNGYYIFNQNEKVIYLTFDCGYEAGYTSKILDTLKSKGVLSTFFVTGSYIDNNPALVKRMVNEGHIVCNHTQNHPNMVTLANNTSAFNNEILSVEAKYKNLVGKDMIKMFRPPSGYYSNRVLCLMQQLNYTTVFWSFAYYDYDTSNQPNPDQAFSKIITSTHPGGIFLLHAVSATNTQILGRVIDNIRAQGYSINQLNV